MQVPPIAAALASADAAVGVKAQKAGAEFEGVLLNIVLGAVERSFSELPGSKVQQEDQAYNGLGMQALASGLARAGGIGLGKMIAAALEKSERSHRAR